MNIDLIIVFQSCINLLCSCNLEIESTTLFFTAMPSFLKYSLKYSQIFA